MRVPIPVLRRGATVLWAAALLLLCLCACSDQVLLPGGETVSINPPAGESGHTGALQLGTEAPTAPVIGITPGDPFANAAHVMRVDFLDLGDADAILLRMDDRVVLVDTGESNDSAAITERLEAYGVDAIDVLIITHYDNDHIGSAAQLLRAYPVGAVYMPDYVRDSRLYRSMVDALGVLSDGGQTAVHRLSADTRVELGYGTLDIDATALYEPGLTLGSDDSHSLEENNYSLITTVTFGDIRLLLAGDAEGARIAELAAGLPADARFDALKIPHHGGYDKELGDFLRSIKGDLRYCMVSVGDASLVEASLVTAMRAAGAGAYYTYNGDIRLSTDGVSMVVEQGS